MTQEPNKPVSEHEPGCSIYWRKDGRCDCAARKSEQKCGAIIHVGFEGATTCANPKVGCIMHDKPQKKEWDSSEGQTHYEGDTDGCKPIQSGYAVSQPPIPPKEEGWETTSEWMGIQNSMFRSYKDADDWSRNVLNDFAAAQKRLKDFISKVEKEAYERGQKYGEELGKAYWEPSEYHKERWRAEGERIRYEKGWEAALGKGWTLAKYLSRARIAQLEEDLEIVRSTVSTWKRPEFQFERHATLIKFTSDAFKSILSQLESALSSLKEKHDK